MDTADQVAADVFSTALEGGIGYWSLATEIEYDPNAADEDVIYLSVKLHEVEEDEEKIDAEDCIITQSIYGSNCYQTEGHTVTRDDVKRAIREIAFKKAGEVEYMSRSLPALCRTLVFDPEDADYDSCVADEIIQYAALGGRIVYG